MNCACGCGVPTNNGMTYRKGHHFRKLASVRFWSKVDKQESCWIWKGRAMSTGYGSFWTGVKQDTAHRFSYELHNGSIPENLCVLHTCDVRLCVNPAHLFVGTKGDNQRDCVAKGRDNKACGEQAAMSKLTTAQVLEIRKLNSENHIGSRTLAKQFGVQRNTIMNILHRITWKHV